MTVIYGDYAILIPLLSVFGIFLMIIAGIYLFIKLWIENKRIKKIREVKGGKI